MPKLLLFVLAPITALVLIACGGGSDSSSSGGSSSDEEAAGKAAAQHVMTFFGLLSGQSKAKDLLNAFAPECRGQVKESELDALLGLVQAFAPQLADAKIEDIDLGKLDYKRTSEGIEVTATDPNSIRVKVKGKWQNANDFFESVGLGDAEDATPTSEPLLLVKRDGKWLMGDCTDLQDFSGS